MTDNTRRINHTVISLVVGDITEVNVDAIVNAANPSLAGGGGVDGAIHRTGGPAILAECLKIAAAQGPLPAGKAVITGGGRLKARHVIHTVGPVWRGGSSREADLLASAYSESLQLATEHKFKSIAFPSISTGAYEYPLNMAAGVAVTAIAGYLEQHQTSLKEIILVLFNRSALEAYAAALKASIAA
ncbi:MAG: O-acetyl-ADP-ribose deacetylase [Dehalococcoidia bacterium]|nr:O-acetyl-ADP-ribose deacetylase [Dehalococcoidia bacterium]